MKTFWEVLMKTPEKFDGQRDSCTHRHDELIKLLSTAEKHKITYKSNNFVF